MHCAGDLVMSLGDINGHVGRDINGFHGVNGEYGVGEMNLEVRMVLVLPGEENMCQIHGLIEEKMKATFRMSVNETEIDSVLTKKEY